MADWRGAGIWLVVVGMGMGCDSGPPGFIEMGAVDFAGFDGGPTDQGTDAAADLSSDIGTSDLGADVSDMLMVEGCADPNGPTVTILTPNEATDPLTDEVVVGDFVEVRCRVARGAAGDARPIDAESVALFRVDAAATVIASPPVTASGDEFRATCNLDEVPNGPMFFRCTARDTAPVPRCNADDRATLYDGGPSIDVITPTPSSIHSDSMTLMYRVEPEPLGPGDTEAEVASHTLQVAGITITAEQTGPSEYTAMIDFTDRSLFPEELAGDYELILRATNGRTPMPGVRQHSQVFTVDTDGPTIDVDQPDLGQLVGGSTLVRAEVTDLSGVDPATVTLRVGGIPFTMMREGASDFFRVTFDASVFASTTVELTLNITATDTVGNTQTVSLLVKLDSVAPVASLDPPAVRDSNTAAAQVLQCSALFDPVGADSVDDGEVVGTAAEFRARVRDLGNSVVGSNGSVIFIGGVDYAEILIQDDVNVPLLVDTNNDGICDAINPVVEPAPANPAPAVLLQLIPVDPAGNAFYDREIVDFNTPGPAYAGAFDDCNPGQASTPPILQCPQTSPLSRIIEGPSEAPAIFVKPPITRATCVGDAFDFVGAGLAEGWACAAVRTADTLGNEGVSPPLRVCFSDGMGASVCPASIGQVVPEAMRPACTDGCALPASFTDYPALQLTRT